MKITLDRTLLLKALSHMQSVVEKRQTVPILANVLLQAEGDVLALKSTDNEIEISEKLTAVVTQAGQATAPARKLYEIVNKLPDGAQIELTLGTDGQLAIDSGRSHFALPSLDANEFPSMEQMPVNLQFSIAPSELTYLINNTIFSVSTEETRYNLNGIYLHAQQKDGVGILRAVATDGHRLACADISVPTGAENMAGVIIPRKTIGEVAKLITESEQPVEIALAAQQIRFTIDGVVLSSRLIEGTYPDYEKVIPTQNDKILEVEADALAQVIERVSVICEKSKGIKLALNQNLLRVYMRNPDEGSAEDELEVSYTDEALETGFNFRSLLDILAQLKGAVVKISFLDDASPVVIMDAKATGALFVLMPMRV